MAGSIVGGTPAEALEQLAQRNAAQPNPTTLAAGTGVRPALVSSRIIEKPGSDFMMDILKKLDLERRCQTRFHLSQILSQNP